MPIYSFINTETQETWEEEMSMAAHEKFLKKNKHIQQQIVKAPLLADPVRMGHIKPDQGFRDLLKEVKRKNGGSSAINTF